MPKTKVHPRPIRVLSKRKLLDVWNGSKDSKSVAGGPGIDAQTARSFGNNLENNVAILAADLASGQFGFSRLRPHLVPKSELGKFRLICVPTVRDRLVQRTIAANLTENDKLRIQNSTSFGFVQGKSAKDALVQVANLRQYHEFVFETDITSFFDQIHRARLKTIVRKSLGRSSLIPLLENVIDCEVKPRNSEEANQIAKQGINAGSGLRQGMPLSPLLANLVLRSFDQKLLRNGIVGVRYADDIVTFAKSRNDANHHMNLIVEELARIGHVIPPIELRTKTRIVGPREKFEFLGREFYYSNRYGAYLQRVSKQKVGKIVKEIEKFGDITELLKNDISFSDHAVKLWRASNSYIRTYADADNAVFVENKVKQAAKISRRRIFEQMFGTRAVSHLSNVHQKFLGLTDNSIDTLEWDDLEDC